MKNPWNDMILLLPLQEFMSLISIQRELCASTSCSIFYVDYLYAAWTLHQVPEVASSLNSPFHGLTFCKV
ncbi:hypothetical protein BHE74_00002734 [Ensete ventricosum]|nr:hypothetical protein GW17_00056756 [Ensete ventricosum]RWW88393.1 hypothetical protein BHE74_00002734 [Ensete ventricosum]RZS02094.1 hypothetical protein BHM03_00032073 [Ensete ventricosum]